jgi:hypothetical protein
MSDHAAVGMLRSIATELEASEEEGELLPVLSVVAPAARDNVNDPSEQEETTTVKLVPELAEGVKAQPVAVPVLLKSAEVRPVTLLSKRRVYESEVDLFGVDGTAIHEAVAWERSTVTVAAVKFVAGPLLLAASETELAANSIITVPLEQESAVTVNEEPEAAEGVKVQPEAEPVLVKSALLRPYTASEKTKV